MLGSQAEALFVSLQMSPIRLRCVSTGGHDTLFWRQIYDILT